MKTRVTTIRERLKSLFPNPQCPLTHDSPVQLLVAVILSAQCTDARVNQVTPALFARFPDAVAFAQAKLKDVEKLIRSTGFFRVKARNIIACCKILVEKHGGEVPGTMEELNPLPGVGRKTANVVLGHAFGIPGITVDTHVGRLSRRLGLTVRTDPEKVERDLMETIPREEWSDFSLRLIFHGRQTCSARRPRCETCTLSEVCPKVGVDVEVKKKNKPEK